MQLILASNDPANPITVDLSPYLNVQDGSGLDPVDPAFSNRVWGRSLLQKGATLAMEALNERGMLFPVKLNQPNTSALNRLVQAINQVVNTPGATCTWQDDGASQPTTFDVLSGLCEIQYRYREAQQHWLDANLRIFSQPLGRMAAPRQYALASGAGPLLVIGPYASGGGQTIAASNGGYAAANQGGTASGAVFYPGAPSLAGDTEALLQISYTGPNPSTATYEGVPPYAIVSLLPDQLYRPVVTASEVFFDTAFTHNPGNSRVSGLGASGTIASSYMSINVPSGISSRGTFLSFQPLAQPSYAAIAPGMQWAGNHRLFAIARASATGGPSSLGSFSPQLFLEPGPGVPFAPGGVSVGAWYASPPVTTPPQLAQAWSSWGLYDLGTFSIRPSEPSLQPIVLGMTAHCASNQSAALDLNALIMVPERTSWFINPTSINPSQYGIPAGVRWFTGAPWSNTYILDDVEGDQFMYGGCFGDPYNILATNGRMGSQPPAPSPIGAIASAGLISQYTRGTVPQPDPSHGLPIIAIIGMGQPCQPAGGALANPLIQPTFAQVNVLERTRYMLP